MNSFGKIHPEKKEQLELKPVAINSQFKQVNPGSDSKFTGYLAFCVLVSGIGAGVQVGWAIAIFNTPIAVVREFYNDVYIYRYNEAMSPSKFNELWSITNGLLPLGGCIGALFSSFVADFFGRKYGMIYSNVFVIIGSIISGISRYTITYETIMVGRFICGFYSGLFTGIMPIYLSEIPPGRLKGFCGALSQIIIVFGILLANIFGLKEILGTKTLWPYLFVLTVVPILMHVFLLYGVESPKHLYINFNKVDAARDALIKLRGADNMDQVEREMEYLAIEKENLAKQEKIKWTDFYHKRTLRRPLLIALGLHIAQQFSGINAVLFYSTRIFNSVGLNGSWATYSTIILSFTQLLMSFACMFIIEKSGRKILLIVGSVGMCLSCFGLAISRILGSSERSWLNYLTVAFAVLYVLSYRIGPGAIPWLLPSEIFASNARAKANSLAVFVNWICSLLVTSTFPLIEEKIGSYTFIIFGVFLVFVTLFIFVFIPETKNKKLHEIVAQFETRIIYLFNRP